MNEQELAAIEARANAATPGPWNLYMFHGEFMGFSGVPREPIAIYPDVLCYDQDDDCINITQEDAQFIAHARQDVPALIAEVRMLNQQVEQPYSDSQAAENTQAKEWMRKALAELEAAEKVCETLEGMHLLLGNDIGPLLTNWRKVQEENKRA